jgi:hypothetical protein
MVRKHRNVLGPDRSIHMLRPITTVRSNLTVQWTRTRARWPWKQRGEYCIPNTAPGRLVLSSPQSDYMRWPWSPRVKTVPYKMSVRIKLRLAMNSVQVWALFFWRSNSEWDAKILPCPMVEIICAINISKNYEFEKVATYDRIWWNPFVPEKWCPSLSSKSWMVEPAGCPEERCPSLSRKIRRSPLEIIWYQWMAWDISPTEIHRFTMIERLEGARGHWITARWG